MSYMEFVFQLVVFDTVKVAFLPVGQMQSYIDQAFNTISRRLHTHEAMTLADLQDILSTY